MRDQSSSRLSAQTGTSWRHSTSGRSPLASSTIRRRKPARRGGSAFPWNRFHVRTWRCMTRRGYGYRRHSAPMHVVLADPPAFTPPYDHELASALARAGARVDLVTSPFRFGTRPTPDGYALDEPFYPRSSRIYRSGPRLAIKALEHPFGMRHLLRM